MNDAQTAWESLIARMRGAATNPRSDFLTLSRLLVEAADRLEKVYEDARDDRE